MITVIGLGEIGGNVFREMAGALGKENVFGADLDGPKLDEFRKQGFFVGEKAPPSEAYIVAVYTTDQVMDVVRSLDYSKRPLVSIESTILPGTSKRILEWKRQNGKAFDLLLFPHRFNPNDAEHHVFNLDRVMGGENEGALERGMELFSRCMDRSLIHPTTLEIAELAKPVENAYRFMEIAVAEQLRKSCEEKGIDFEELRKAASTKWNIKIYEAREGIGGKCLPKDIQLINSFFPDNELFKKGYEFNEKYKKWFSEKAKDRQPLDHWPEAVRGPRQEK